MAATLPPDPAALQAEIERLPLQQLAAMVDKWLPEDVPPGSRTDPE